MSEYNCRVKRVVPKNHLITVNYVSETLLFESGYVEIGQYKLVFNRFRFNRDDEWDYWYLSHSKCEIPDEFWDLKVPDWIGNTIDWIILTLLHGKQT